MAALYDVPAPAKINLFLHVTGRRADGYHLLETVFRFIDLSDTLHFDARSDGRIVREGCAVEGLSPEDDLVVRAAHALQAATGTRQGCQVRYQKNIPSGAGLGGGSSDAASTLIALNRLWKTGLNRQQLMALALPLGADVPVFVHGQPAFATGIGEVLTPVQLPERSYLVVQPPQNVATARVFADSDLTRNSASLKIAVFADWQKINAPDLFGRNDLEPVVFARYPRVAALYQWLTQQGLTARMSGSGSCFFVEFVTMKQAQMCQQQIIGKIPSRESEAVAVVQQTWACQGLMDHPLRDWISS
ncbi:4-(cytidine 5'-diphospho)-2-C-methyl-D-erythritol kinase [Pollutimonas thiosulfatoxidans]|uniref:4-diphosphocytidyl-2-C-methyl-D-erythritol kinase n=1 Tax=Pollutimonas thiosulfatoxidans TaxID=2028345 RepID=A0A410G882_9BURK|nr:4-(cytidine 5'-diphospho)-2-C-methyl-D-erythritol kinase [Pollutimonas thiosulfatoxidans]QAA92507.1 4-(cytidine 5'-diphospho)-2-C-methyl-D-erythritol kinase [Pollutimonas thiosulfatoxidans]